MSRPVCIFALTCVLVFGHSANAGIYENIYRGLELFATPSGFPVQTTGDGTRVNGARSGRLRIVPNGIGPGYELQLDRTFGNDSRGRPETFHLGGFGELTLSGQTQTTAGYIGDEFRVLYGTSVANNLTYQLRSRVGVQDVQVNGALSYIADWELNPLGFYTVSVNVAHEDSQLILDGVVARDEDDINFDIGPINVRGNIFYDGLLAMLAGLGVDTSELEEVFPSSPIDQINDEIQEQLQGLASLVGGETLFSSTGVLDPVSDAVFGELTSEIIGFVDGSSQQDLPSAVPEPGTLLLIVAGALLARPRRFA